MSRGIGQRQRAILYMLDRSEGGLMVFDLAPGGDSIDPSSGASTRRALYRLRTLGLVEQRWYYSRSQGRPASWAITDAGREVVRAFAGSTSY